MNRVFRSLSAVFLSAVVMVTIPQYLYSQTSDTGTAISNSETVKKGSYGLDFMFLVRGSFGYVIGGDLANALDDNKKDLENSGYSVEEGAGYPQITANLNLESKIYYNSIGFGVSAGYYSPFGNSLRWTDEDGFGRKYSLYLSSYSVLGNIFYRIEISSKKYVYFGAGMGKYWVKLEEDTYLSNNKYKDDTLGFHGEIGIDFKFTEYVFFAGIRGQYASFDQFESGGFVLKNFNGSLSGIYFTFGGGVYF